MKNFDLLIFGGDIHDKYYIILNFIEKYEIKNSAIIIAGDFGIGFKHPLKEKSKLKKLNYKLLESNNTIFVVRGNHDDPSYFYGNNDKTNIKFVPDYTVLNINNQNILCVGGAVSIDRVNRESYTEGRGRDWWSNEIFNYDPKKIETLTNIDVVVTHSAPNFAYPYLKNGAVEWLK